MAIPMNLAMTAAEFCTCPPFPPETGWMACHFSSSGRGLSNLPQWLPPGSLLILDDQIPISGHDRDYICQTLFTCVRDLECCGILLDFQRPDVTETAALTARLAALPCPVAVTPLYARGNGAAVFLPPLPCHISLAAWAAPWQGRTLWLELALDRELIKLTETGVEISPGDFEAAGGFADESLHCHYKAALEEEAAVFRLWRTRTDIQALLKEADRLDIRRAVGLYQELSE